MTKAHVAIAASLLTILFMIGGVIVWAVRVEGKTDALTPRVQALETSLAIVGAIREDVTDVKKDVSWLKDLFQNRYNISINQ